MTKIEGIIVAVIVVLILLLAVQVRSCSSALENAGGLRGVIVEAGKEIKEIKQEIEDEKQ